MEISLSVIKPWLIVALMIIIGFIVIKILDSLTAKALNKSSIDPTLHKFIRHGVVAICWIVLIGVALPYIGVSLSTFIAVLGVAGAAIALALKDSLGNIAGGIIIIVSKPFKKGDTVEISGTIGTVDQIDLIFTTLLTPDNRMAYIPNGKLSTSTIVNYTSEERRRVDCKFGVSNKSCLQKAKEILWSTAEKNDLIMKDPAPVIGIAEQSDGMVYIDMRVWCATENVLSVKYFLEENVKMAFDEAGIETQTPYVNVYIKK